MKTKPVIFLGSSLRLTEARAILDADYHPPVKRGDIDRLCEKRQPSTIAIIDGEFFQSLAISPKEILRAMERGVRVWGASSLGALRAVELLPFGMTGVGKVFELFKSGRVTADDEVAVVYSPEDGRPLSEAMINIRIALGEAQRKGVIQPPVARRLIRNAQSLYFPERSWPALWRKASSWMPERDLSSLKRYIARTKPDVKRDDARLLLRTLRLAEKTEVRVAQASACGRNCLDTTY
jgi:hypothetical protein